MSDKYEDRDYENGEMRLHMDPDGTYWISTPDAGPHFRLSLRQVCQLSICLEEAIRDA